MSQITIQCRLFADEPARQYLWQLMCDRNTPLVNELLRLVALHPDFITWRSKGKLPTAEVTKLAEAFKTDPRFSGQPARFHVSAKKTALYTFKSWLAIQKRTQMQLEGKLSWLRMLRTDEELIADSGQDLDRIRQQAETIVLRCKSPDDTDKYTDSLRKSLYKTYDNNEGSLTRSAIAYLLKHRCQIPKEIEEDTKKFLKYRRKIENQVKRLTQQLENRLPRGRDITGERFLTTLESATNNVPCDEAEASKWQSQLLKRPDLVPFPFITETNTDLKWCKLPEGQIGLHFEGLSEHEFTIGCGQRQLHYFQKFLSDYQVMLASEKQHKKNKKNQSTKNGQQNIKDERYTSSLFLLRSAKLIWTPQKGKGEPWNIHQLYLSCTLETRLLTAEGTEIVKKEVFENKTKELESAQGKIDRTKGQDGNIVRIQSTLNKLNQPFSRPSKPIYQGRSNIIVAVSMGLQSPVTAIVIDIITQKILVHYSTKQLLGDNYRHLNRQRNLQNQQRHLSHKAQKLGQSRQFSNSELGEYLDRLFAKAIVELAQTGSPPPRVIRFAYLNNWSEVEII